MRIAAAALGVALAGCVPKEDRMVADLCEGMTEAALKGQPYHAAIDEVRAQLESQGIPPALQPLWDELTSAPHEDQVQRVKAWARGRKKTFDCPRWEYRLGPPQGTRLVQTRMHVSAVLVHAGALYWIEGGTLSRAEPDGTRPRVIHRVRGVGHDRSDNGDLVRLVADGGSLYWIAGDRVWRFALPDGAPAPVVDAEWANALHVDGSDLFVTARAGLLRVPLDGGVPVTVAAETQARFVYASEGWVWWTAGAGHPSLRRTRWNAAARPETLHDFEGHGSVALAPNGIWIADLGLSRFAFDGRRAEQLPDALASLMVRGFAVSGEDAIVAYYENGVWPNTASIALWPLRKGAAPRLLDTGFQHPTHLQVADGWAYWSDTTGVYRLKLP